MENDKIYESRVDLSGLNKSVEAIKNELRKVIVGQEKMIESIIVAILANGHVLLEGVPGIAKTLTAKLIAKTISVNFSRIQFTPDLMPSDILGTSVFNMKNSEFEFKAGPVFSNIVLIDEINRSPAKTQSALFEVMEERQISIDGNTYKMETPFIVLATQNPIDLEGTYRLPEAQLDRFLFKITVSYPTTEQESLILQEAHERKEKTEISEIKPVLTKKQIDSYQKIIKSIHIEKNLINYIAEFITRTRNNSALFLGGSPRASLAILNSAKVLSAIRNRDFVTPDDIKEVALPVLRHRVILTPEKEMEGLTADEVIINILDKIEVPR